jgi:hypothetical protein
MRNRVLRIYSYNEILPDNFIHYYLDNIDLECVDCSCRYAVEKIRYDDNRRNPHLMVEMSNSDHV